MSNENDLCWIAGFFDGEGCICTSRHKASNGKRYRHISVRVAQTEYSSLKLLQDTFGGHLNEIHPQNATKRTWLWGLTGRRRVGEFADIMLPYLRIKQTTLQEKLDEYDSSPVAQACE